MEILKRHSLTRREAMKAGLKASAYAAPVILSASVPAIGVAAATPGPGATFGQDALITGAASGAVFDVYYTLNSQPAGTLTLLGTVTADRFGFGGGIFPLTVDPATVTSVKLTYVLHGNPATSPPAATFTSNVAGLLSRGTPTFAGLVVQEPTVAACQTGPLNQFNETIDVAIIRGTPNTSYDFYVQPNTVGVPVKVTTATTNANGNITVFASPPAPITSASAPSSVVVTAVLAGGSPASPAFSLTAGGGTLVSIACTSLQSAGSGIRAIGIG